jgi:chitin disaccharide deacetylase
MRVLVVNADDFGRSDGINRGVVHAHDNGIVTSASLMVRWPAATAAVLAAQEHPSLAVGLHVDLSEWSVQGGRWVRLYDRVRLDDPDAVAAEVDLQLAELQRLLGRPPTHLDSHQHLHREEPLRSVLRDRGRTLGVPVRELTPSVRYTGSFYGQHGAGNPYPEGITVSHLVQTISGLAEGVTELGCHPAAELDFESTYRDERLVELATLCSSDVRAALGEHGVELRSFADALPTP